MEFVETSVSPLDLGCLPFTVQFASLWSQNLKCILVLLSQPLGSSACHTEHRDNARVPLLYHSFIMLSTREFYNICCLLELCLKSTTQVFSTMWFPKLFCNFHLAPHPSALGLGDRQPDSRVQCQKSINFYFHCFFSPTHLPLPVHSIGGPVMK